MITKTYFEKLDAMPFCSDSLMRAYESTQLDGFIFVLGDIRTVFASRASESTLEVHFSFGGSEPFIFRYKGRVERDAAFFELVDILKLARNREQGIQGVQA